MRYFYDKIEGRKEFLTFDDLDVLRMFEDNIDLFVEKFVIGKDFLFIDEFSPRKFYVFCEDICGNLKYSGTDIVFTNHLNVFKLF